MKFKVGMQVKHKNGHILTIEDIYYSGELGCEIIWCTDGSSYINDHFCEIEPIK